MQADKPSRLQIRLLGTFDATLDGVQEVPANASLAQYPNQAYANAWSADGASPRSARLRPKSPPCSST